MHRIRSEVLHAAEFLNPTFVKYMFNLFLNTNDSALLSQEWLYNSSGAPVHRGDFANQTKHVKNKFLCLTMIFDVRVQESLNY